MTLDDYKAEIGRLTAERDRLRTTLGFFRSVIKSGEQWSEQCETEYRRALAEHVDRE